jgi:hypothetical protein
VTPGIERDYLGYVLAELKSLRQEVAQLRQQMAAQQEWMIRLQERQRLYYTFAAFGVSLAGLLGTILGRFLF